LPTIRELSSGSSNRTPSAAISAIRANPGCDQAHTEECREAGSEEQLLKEVRQSYNGKIVVGHDLEIF
jgi:quinolinate synthase